MTLKTLSERAGLHVTYLSRIERHHSSPTWEKICDLIDALGITLEDLVKAVKAAGDSKDPAGRGSSRRS